MTFKERADELMAHGAALQIYPPRGPAQTLLLAGLRWDDKPTRFRWCAIFPVDQHHVHETAYATGGPAAQGRDVALYAEDGSMVGYICPYEESGLATDQARDALAAWRGDLAHDGNEKTFDKFFNNI